MLLTNGLMNVGDGPRDFPTRRFDFPSSLTTNLIGIRKSRVQSQSNCSPRDSNNVINVSKFRLARVSPLPLAAVLCCYNHARECLYVERMARIALLCGQSRK